MAYAAVNFWFEPTRISRTSSATETGKLPRRFPGAAGSTSVAVNKIPTYSVTQKIRALSSWGNNWNGAGAIEISPASINRATTLIDELYDTSVELCLNWCDPNVTASIDGEVVFEWWNRNKKVTIYISESQSEYVKVWGPDIVEEMEDGVLTKAMAAELLYWLEA